LKRDPTHLEIRLDPARPRSTRSARPPRGERAQSERSEPSTPSTWFEDVQQVAAFPHARIARVLRAHGRSLDGLGDEPPELAHDRPVLASCYAASAADSQLLGDTAGQPTLKLVQAVRAVRPVERALAEVGGVNIRAEVAFDGRDRKRLEHVLRYMARPPLALARLAQRGHGARKRSDEHLGVHRLPLRETLARRCARCRALAPPRFHLLRYYGVLSAHGSSRTLAFSSVLRPWRRPKSDLHWITRIFAASLTQMAYS